MCRSTADGTSQRLHKPWAGDALGFPSVSQIRDRWLVSSLAPVASLAKAWAQTRPEGEPETSLSRSETTKGGTAGKAGTRPGPRGAPGD